MQNENNFLKLTKQRKAKLYENLSLIIFGLLPLCIILTLIFIKLSYDLSMKNLWRTLKRKTSKHNTMLKCARILFAEVMVK